MQTPVVYFDFDGTLTTGDTLIPFLRYISTPLSFWFKMLRASPYLLAYKLKIMANDVAKQHVLRIFLKGKQLSDLQSQGTSFNQEIVARMLRAEGMEKLKWHIAQGHQCILVSASLDVYLAEWAKENGFTDYLTSSLITTPSGQVTGELFGENCFGTEKCRRIEEWEKRTSRAPSNRYAYGDTAGDLPMLKMAHQGFLLGKSGFERI
ncbi:HAD family hydrolase [Alteromonas sp. a30]|uniref:HAD family hydrolase n=1 Tax=Alteromonas sp. a30 TaxID=2730917 RepID=UPI00227EB0C1|nr:HAD family hydrolase [Alteromonas sp. a30]MCY7295033.1 HAD family hydrolase [Alteromonas sp. a30]